MYNTSIRTVYYVSTLYVNIFQYLNKQDVTTRILCQGSFQFLWQDLVCDFIIPIARIIFPLRNRENDRQQTRNRSHPTYIPFITLVAPPRL